MSLQIQTPGFGLLWCHRPTLSPPASFGTVISVIKELTLLAGRMCVSPQAGVRSVAAQHASWPRGQRRRRSGLWTDEQSSRRTALALSFEV